MSHIQEKSVDIKKLVHILRKTYEAGFYAGNDAINKDVRDEYTYMQSRRRKYVSEIFKKLWIEQTEK